ncbi:MAG: type VI secretion system contractile sheath small subunit [Myxococcota bacterium]|nr:type VI secretion system contractile sheath small subunit [Myxococcota bacterium]
MAINQEIPKSRLTLTYKTQVEGQKEEVTLPFRMLVMGDLSAGTSTDRANDLDARNIRQLDGTNLNAVLKDMGVSIKMTVPNRIDAENSEGLDIEIPIESMKSFEPLAVGNAIPKVKGLMLLKKLLLEAQSNLDNRKDFRRLVQALSDSPDAVSALQSSLKDHTCFKVPTKVVATAEEPAAE